MKLKDLTPAKPTLQVAKVFESYFGSRMQFNALTAPQCRTMLKRVREVLGETRRSRSFHRSEQNPAYLKLVMMEQGLSARLMELAPTDTAGTLKAIAGMAAGAATKATAPTSTTNTQVDPKLKAARDKIAKGQTLTPDEQKIVNTAAAAMTENKLRRAYAMLKESQVQQAQITLAAQEMVDKMQTMIEDISELQFKELPALVESIKNDPQLGMDKATQFNSDVTAALTGLLQNVQGAKQQLDQALGVVTGQAPAGADMGTAGADMAVAGADMAAGAQAADAGMDQLDTAAADAASDMTPAEEPEPTSAAALGRQRR